MPKAKTVMHPTLDRTAPEILIRIFENLSCIHDALNLSQISSRLHNIWTEHSHTIVPVLVYRTIEFAEQADALVKFQSDYPTPRRTHDPKSHCKTVHYMKKLLENERLSQRAMKELKAQMMLDDVEYNPDIPGSPGMTKTERQDFLRAIYRALLAATIILRVDDKIITSELPNLFAKCPALELQQVFALAPWIFGPQSDNVFVSDILHCVGADTFQNGADTMDVDNHDCNVVIGHFLEDFERAHDRWTFDERTRMMRAEYPSFLHRFFQLYSEFSEAGLGRGKLVGEVFRKKVVVKEANAQWWEVHGVWDI